MKRLLLISITMLLFFGCQEVKEMKAPPVDTKIYIRLVDEIPDNETNIYPYIQLYDNDLNVSESSKASIERFTSPVYKGKKVKWKSSKKSLEKIKVNKIKHKGTSIDILEGENISKEPGVVEFKVKEGLKEGDEETYLIEIEVDGIKYTIDPVLKYHEK